MRIKTTGKVEAIYRHRDSTTIKIDLPDDKSVEFRVKGECATPKLGTEVAVYIEWVPDLEGEHVDLASLSGWRRLLKKVFG